MRKNGFFIPINLVFSLIICQNGAALTVPDKVHPGYDLVRIRPDDFKPQVTDLFFNSKKELLFTNYNIGTGHNWNMSGEVFLLRGTEGTDGNAVNVIKFADGFKDPMGLAISNDSVYVVSRGAVTVLFDNDGDGKADFRKVIFKIETYDERMWSYGPVRWGNHLYVLNGCHMTVGSEKSKRCKSASPMRGVLYRIDGAGKEELWAGGFRQPNGIAVSPKGEIFVTDNQGEWLPSNKLIHIKKGRYYGQPQIHHSATPWDESIPESPPAVWAVHDEIAWSPTYPGFVKTGLYRGQILAGDNNFGGIQRYFLERVKGEYQGAIFQFTGGLEVGMNAIEEGPDSALYMGGIGDGSQGRGAWGWKKKRFGLQKLVPNGTIAFEMLAIRSKADGFEIEFTQAPNEAASVAANYALDKAGFKPGPGYGEGNMVERTRISVQSVKKVSATRYHLILSPADLAHIPGLTLKSTVFHFKLSNITSAAGGEIWSSEAWYTLNNIGPSEKVGCKEKDRKGYDPEADYDDGFRCGQVTSAARPQPDGPFSLTIRQLGRNILYRSQFDAPYMLEVVNIHGRRVMSHPGRGAHLENLDISHLATGIYFARITQASRAVEAKIILF